MRNRAEDISTYTFRQEDELLIDTNVWFSIYGLREPGNRKVAIYSEALGRILAARCRIYVDVLVISEFTNLYARIKHQLQSPGRPFKVFRKSQAFKFVAREIAEAAGRILRHCTRLESGFETLDVNELLDEYAEGDSDFNDQVLARLCRSRGLKLVTDDGDFARSDLAVVTANARLLVQS
jgi:predicted nucleic acid-binding protein